MLEDDQRRNRRERREIISLCEFRPSTSLRASRAESRDASSALTGSHEFGAETVIRILCVDDHRIVREGIASLIDRQPDMRVVASAASGEEAIDLFIEHQPDITLMDLQLGVMDGITAIKIIRRRSPGARIVVLTMRRGDEDIHRALEAGASAYLMKDTISDDLIR